MRILSTTLETARHAIGATAEAAVVMAIAVTLVLGVAVVGRDDPAGAADVYAARGGNGGGNGGNGGGNAGTAPDSSISLNQAGPFQIGDPVTFTTSAVGLNGGEYPLVYVECRDFGDGSVLYGQLDYPDATFILGGGSSPWWLVRNDAMCSAVLYSYGGKTKGGYDEIRLLAGPEYFYAGG